LGEKKKRKMPVKGLLVSFGVELFTLTRPREKNLRFEPNASITAHDSRGCGVWKRNQICPLLFLQKQRHKLIKTLLK